MKLHLASLPSRLVLVVVLAVIGSSCRPSDKAGAPAAGGAPPGKPAVRKVPVEVETLTPRALPYTVETVGSVEPREVVRVPARVAGILEGLSFDAGTAVRRGQVLARIDAERYRLALARAEAGVQQAEATAREAADVARRRQELSASGAGIVSSEDAANAQMRAETANAELAAARAARDLAAKDLHDSEVRAEIDGVVEEKLVATGQHVDVGDPIATLVDSSRLRLVFHVSETESGRLLPSSTVSFKVRSMPEREMVATLAHVGQVADSSTRQIECQAWIEDPPPGLKPGFFAEVTVQVGESAAALVVPQAAAQPTDRGFVAYVVDDAGVAHERKVQLGLSTRDGGVEVLSGLAAGERVVVKGAAALREGAQVVVSGAAGAAP